MGIDPRRDFGRFWWSAPILVVLALGVHWCMHVPTGEIEPRTKPAYKHPASKKKKGKRKGKARKKGAGKGKAP